MPLSCLAFTPPATSEVSVIYTFTSQVRKLRATVTHLAGGREGSELPHLVLLHAEGGDGFEFLGS